MKDVKFTTIEGGEIIPTKQTLTHWSSPDEIIASGYGKITYREWCDREQARINSRGDGVKIITRVGGDRNGYIALYRTGV